jgi:hypothetical protein
LGVGDWANNLSPFEVVSYDTFVKILYFNRFFRMTHMMPERYENLMEIWVEKLDEC